MKRETHELLYGDDFGRLPASEQHLYPSMVPTTVPTTTTSFYIPRMSVQYDEQRVKNVFSSVLFIGVVRRVDFVPIEGSTRFHKAFLHFDRLYDNGIAKAMLDGVENGSARIQPSPIDKSFYWIVLKNKRPIPETNLNIHQIADNARILQSVVEQQANEILALQQLVEQHANALREKMDCD